MKIECTVNELNELMNKKTTSNADTSDVSKNTLGITKEVLNQVYYQDLLVHIDTKSPSLIALTELLKKK